MSAKLLNPTKALLFRIVHRANLGWIAANGIHCANSPIRDPNFRAIGNAELIGRRRHRQLPQPFGGYLSDYVPFYFTPFSPMMLNIKTGYSGVPKQRNEDIVIFVTSVHRLNELNVPFVFSDRHAYLTAARFTNDPANLAWIDWPMLAARDFRRDPNDPSKFERYEAEGLVRGHVPVEALIGVGCYNHAIAEAVANELTAAGRDVQARSRPEWYF